MKNMQSEVEISLSQGSLNIFKSIMRMEIYEFIKRSMNIFKCIAEKPSYEFTYVAIKVIFFLKLLKQQWTNLKLKLIL